MIVSTIGIRLHGPPFLSPDCFGLFEDLYSMKRGSEIFVKCFYVQAYVLIMTFASCMTHFDTFPHDYEPILASHQQFSSYLYT